MSKTIIFLSFLLFNFAAVFAQRLEPGVGIGVGNSSNDIATNLRPGNSRLGGEIFLRYNLSPVSAFRLSLAAMQFRGSDLDSKDFYQLNRALSFQTDLTEISLRYEYNFINFRQLKEMRKLSPFLFFGANYAYFASKTNIHPPFRAKTFALPLGIGVKYAMAYNWNLTWEIGMRKTFSDLLDGFDAAKETAKFQRGNAADKDTYFYAGISISYLFEGVVCPQRFKNPFKVPKK
jgi:hypothetical protein